MGKVWEIDSHTFPTVWVLFSHSIPILRHTSSYEKCMGFPMGHAIPRYRKLVSIDSQCMGIFFSQFMENRWRYPYLSHSWVLRDFWDFKQLKITAVYHLSIQHVTKNIKLYTCIIWKPLSRFHQNISLCTYS